MTEFACRSEKALEVIKFLKSKDIFEHDRTNKDGIYPIFILAQEGRIDAIKYAHEECGMSLTSKHEKDGYNAFLLAIRFEQIEVVTYFLQKAKESKEVKDLIDSQLVVKTSKEVVIGNESPFTLACSLGTGNVELVRIMWEHNCHLQPLHEAQEHARPMKILFCKDEDEANQDAEKEPTKVFRKFKSFPVIPQSAISSSSSKSSEKYTILCSPK